MWKSHWGFEREPFAESGSPYVSLPSHDEAVARLAHAIESGERRAWLTAEAGLGKSTVLRQAFEETRDPHRRFVILSCPREGTLLWAMLAERWASAFSREPAGSLPGEPSNALSAWHRSNEFTSSSASTTASQRANHRRDIEALASVGALARSRESP